MLTAKEIKEGEFTYGQKIELTNALRRQEDETKKIKRIAEILNGKPLNVVQIGKQYKEILKCMEALKFWIELESKFPRSELSGDEIRAGAKDLTAEIGEAGQAISIGARFGKLPSEILDTNYNEIFLILNEQAHVSAYEKRLRAIYDNKRK